MKADDLQIFIDGALEFFDINLGKGQIAVGQPALQQPGVTVFYEYTGVITIFGDRTGKVFFSAPMNLMTHLLESMGEKNVDDELIADVVGEIANSIAGNARSHYGSGFCLSVPTILKDTDLDGELSSPASGSYVIPLRWKDTHSSVSVWFE